MKVLGKISGLELLAETYSPPSFSDVSQWSLLRHKEVKTLGQGYAFGEFSQAVWLLSQCS